MIKQLSDAVWDALVCPYCAHPLDRAEAGASCRGCGTEYPYTTSGSLDLRLRAGKKYQLEFQVGSPLESDVRFEPLKMNDEPAVDFSHVRVPYHLTKEMLSYFPGARGPGSLALDLGCGDAVHRGVCEHAGFEYVGLDYETAGALVKGDAHALPFKDDSFEFILSVAVLEHLQYPFVTMREAYRVLKPGGTFIGTVAFLEPFHANSFYHHTHLGTFNSLHFGGFKIVSIAPSEKWLVFDAQASMRPLPAIPPALCKAVELPRQVFHKLWWQLVYLRSRRAESYKQGYVRDVTGAFSFIATKGAD